MVQPPGELYMYPRKNSDIYVREKKYKHMPYMWSFHRVPRYYVLKSSALLAPEHPIRIFSSGSPSQH